MKLLFLAFRNLLRNRRRSMTTLLAMIVGATTVLLFGGYIRDIKYGLQTDYVQRSGHFQIQHKNYFLYGSGNPTAYGIKNYERVISVIKNDPILAPMLLVVTPTLQMGGIAGNFAAGVSRTVLGTGVVVDDQNKLREWNDYQFPITLRPSPLTGSSPESAIVGTGVARVLQLCDQLKVSNCINTSPVDDDDAPAASNSAPADITALSAVENQTGSATGARPAAQIELLAASAQGAPNVSVLNVSKAEEQGVKELDDVYLTFHLAQAQQLVYGNSQKRATAILLQLKHTDQMPAAKSRLDYLLSSTLKGMPLEIQNFANLNPFYDQSIRMFDAIFGFISVLIGAIVLFTVGNTMSMAIVERTVEIGTLRAIGLRRFGIRKLFVCEGALLGIAGAALGVGTALVVAGLINKLGLSWTPPARVDLVPLTVRVWGESGMIFIAATSLIFIATVSAWWPARRASSMNIVDALRHV
jgi:putative ABC transport system permease protein